ncbi:MAG: type II toxin-antitoxin system HipA family toxin [Thauera sp.]|nr:type II toxin-antitoxin system HipA family toxin [Thauera sp.]
MSSISERSLYVGLHLPGASLPVPAGLMRVVRDGLSEEGVFAYGRGYLARPDAVSLNPAYLPLGPGVTTMPRRRLRDGGALNQTFRDALPDAWGRLVLAARNDWRELDDVDVLLATNADRVGAMTFAESPSLGAVDGPLERYALEDLAEAAHRLAFDMEVPREMRRLLRHGGSLGGVRPKATLIRGDALWMAKFPARDDELDVETLEACTMALARRCGIRVPEFELVPLRSARALVLRRFDRPGSIERDLRLHYLSAAAFTDSPYASSEGSYVRLARHLRLHGADVASDLRELFRRLVFNLFIDNSDDHVKNHGVLHVAADRFRLAPAFDLVPQLGNLGYQGMAIVDGRPESDLSLALDHSAEFGLSRHQASDEIQHIRVGVGAWRSVFEATGADAQIMRRVEHCFGQQARLIGA